MTLYCNKCDELVLAQSEHRKLVMTGSKHVRWVKVWYCPRCRKELHREV